MPYVNVRITKDGVTAEQKAQIVAEITDTLQRVLGKCQVSRRAREPWFRLRE